MKATRHRTLQDLERDCTLPVGPKGYGGDERFSPTWDKRIEGIREVLCRLPADQYDQWKARIQEVAWFIPDYRLWGQIDVFPNKCIIYLNPILECSVSQQSVVALVVHEMAHFLLKHQGADLSIDEKESQVNQAIRAWGFSEEADISDKELWTFWKGPPPQDKAP